MRVLLDTNAYVAFCQGHRGVVDVVANADVVVMSTVVLGELLYGFRHGSRYNQNLGILESFLAEPDVTILSVSYATAGRFGSILATLRAVGRPIPTNDVWIAAHAMEAHASLVSFDAHFRHVDGLDLVEPVV